MNRFTLLMAAFPFVLYACGSDDSGGGGGTGGKKDAGTDSGKGGTGGGTGATGGVGALGGTGAVGGSTGGAAGSGGGVAGAAGSGGLAGAAGVAGGGGTAGVAGSAGTTSGGTAGTDAGVAGAAGSAGTPSGGGTAGTDGGVSALGDTCGNPFLVGALPFTMNGDTTGVGEDYGFTGTSCPPTTFDKGAGSPDHVYAFTATATGKYIVTLDSVFDAALYVVTDCQNIDTTCLGGVDQTGSSAIETLSIDAQAGTTYYVIVDGYQATPPGAAGTYTLDIEEAPPPPLDEPCINGTVVGALPYTNSSTTVGAPNTYAITSGACPGITSSFTGAGATDVVYTFTPTVSAKYTATVTTTSFDAMLYVSTVCTSPLTVCLGGSDSSTASGTETVSFNAIAGKAYNIFVDGFSTTPSTTNQGPFTLEVKTAPPPPANDTCATATAITTLPFSGTGSTVDATNDYGFASNTCQPAGSSLGNASNDVAFSLTPSITGSYTISLSGFDVVLYVVTDCTNITSTTCVGGVDSTGASGTETLTLNLTAGTTYYIMVDGYSNSSNLTGSYQLDVVKDP